MTTEQSGIRADPAGIRISRMAESLAVMKSLWSTGEATYQGEYYQVAGAVGSPAPVQRPHPPIIIGGGGQRVLGIAAREADIVGVNPSLAAGYIGPEVLETTSAEYYHQRIEWIRQAAGARFDQLELQVLTFLVQVVPDRDEAVARLAGALSVTPEQIDGSPIALIGTTDEITETPAAAAGRVRLLLHRGARGGDGGVRAGGGHSRRDLGVPAPGRASASSAAPSTPSTPPTWRWPRWSRVTLGLDRMLLVVANRPWQKEGERVRSPRPRTASPWSRRPWPDGPASSPAGWRSTGEARPTPSTPSGSSSGTNPGRS